MPSAARPLLLISSIQISRLLSVPSSFAGTIFAIFPFCAFCAKSRLQPSKQGRGPVNQWLFFHWFLVAGVKGSYSKSIRAISCMILRGGLENQMSRQVLS